MRHFDMSVDKWRKENIKILEKSFACFESEALTE